MTPSYVKRARRFENMLKDGSSDLEASFISNNPIAVIDGALEREGHFSYFTAFSLACTFFEYLSYVTLRKKERNKKGEKIEVFLNKGKYGPKLYELIDRLKEECIITPEIFDKMNKVRCIRNKMVHSRGDISKLYQPTEDERLLIEDAKNCITILLEYKPCKKKK